MKRDWQLIRAILNNEDLSEWPVTVCHRHYQILCERGWLHGGKLCGDGETFWISHPTIEGLDAAAKLENKERLTRVLDSLQARRVGATEAMVFNLIEALENSTH